MKGKWNPFIYNNMEEHMLHEVGQCNINCIGKLSYAVCSCWKWTLEWRNPLVSDLSMLYQVCTKTPCPGTSRETVEQQTLKDIKTMHPWSLSGAIAGCKYALPRISILLTPPCLINLHCVCSNVCRAHTCIFEDIRGQCWVSFLDTVMDLNPGPHGSAAGCFSHWTISAAHIPNSIHSLPFSTLSPIFLSFWS